jgi:hypothetical protein
MPYTIVIGTHPQVSGSDSFKQLCAYAIRGEAHGVRG